MPANYQIISQWDLGEFLNYDLIQEHRTKNIFDIMRHPRCRFYKGPWGQELIVSPEYDCEAEAYVWATRRRAREIKQWFDERKPDVCSGFD